jgi:hypothetical protein
MSFKDWDSSECCIPLVQGTVIICCLSVAHSFDEVYWTFRTHDGVN